MGLFSRNTAESTQNIAAVCTVDLPRYLGKWYEICRLPHSFEKDLENVTANYNLKNDGKIEVVNAGTKNGQKKEARATAWIPDKNCTGKLFVSFFRPFKSEYKIIKLDESGYSFAVVTSSSKKYLWILSRTPSISAELYDELISYVTNLGFDTSKIILVSQAGN